MEGCERTYHLADGRQVTVAWCKGPPYLREIYTGGIAPPTTHESRAEEVRKAAEKGYNGE